MGIRLLFNLELSVGRPTGVGYYTKALYENLQKYLPNNWELIGWPPSEEAILELDEWRISRMASARRLTLSRILKLGQEIIGKGLLIRQLSPTIYHTTDPFLPMIPLSCVTVATVNDMWNWKRPVSGREKWHILRYRLLAPLSLKKANQIVTISRFTSSELLSYFPCFEKKVSIIPLAVDHDYYNKGESAESKTLLEREFGIKKDFFLFVGSIYEPRKNFKLLADTWELFCERHPDKELITVGRTETTLPSSTVVSSSPLSGNIHSLGYISNDLLRHLYRTALALVFPSFYEGFGLPILEAMACGCPVIVSDIPVLKEVGGEACLKFEQGEKDSLLAMMEKSLDGEIRNKLITDGLERVKLFTWKRHVETVIELYIKSLPEKYNYAHHNK